MMKAVLDTNILVSALWSRKGAPARLLGLVISGKITPCYDHRILTEYRDVLMRPKFKFSKAEVNALLAWIIDSGYCVIADPCDTVFTDAADKKFYEVAKRCGAWLVTGNMKHFPEDECIVTVSGFLSRFEDI